MPHPSTPVDDTPRTLVMQRTCCFPFGGQLEDVRLGSMEAFGRPAYLACELCVCLMEIYRIVFSVLAISCRPRSLYVRRDHFIESFASRPIFFCKLRHHSSMHQPLASRVTLYNALCPSAALMCPDRHQPVYSHLRPFPCRVFE
jgi:hypothetical protein